MGVGGLKTLSTVWAVAGSVLQQIRFVAREVFRLPPPGEMSVGPMGPGQGGEEEVLRFMDEERGIAVGEADWQSGRVEWDGT